MDEAKYLRASDGTGEAVLGHVQSDRLVGATVLDIDNTDNWPEFFILTTGTLAANGYISEDDMCIMLCHLDGGTVEIDGYADGYSDVGNTEGQIAVIKQATEWANRVTDAVEGVITDTDNFIASNGDWRDIPGPVISVTALGNGSFSVVTTGDDTDIVSEGMRVRTTRTVPASNTSFSLDGTNDYYVKTSPNKMTWTDDFANGWWIYLTSYPTGNAAIASRENGSSGWSFRINPLGQVVLVGQNANAANYSAITSYQSVPLNKWVHVAAQLDMSAYTATPTTSYVMIGGADVPAYVSRGGTNPTALVQAGNFEIGSYNGGTNPFPGYIGDGGVFSAKVTQANMLAFMNQPPTGSETNLASGYANGSVNDLNTTTPNNLTATNGATTVANAPYGDKGLSTTFDYGIIMKKTFSTNTTLIIQVPEGCTIPTTGGISAIDYSVVDVPYGFPRNKGRWDILMYARADYNKSVGEFTTYYVTPFKLTIPIGDWIIGYKTTFRFGGNVPAATVRGSTLLTEQTSDFLGSATPSQDPELSANGYVYTNTQTVAAGQDVSAETSRRLTTAKVYSLAARVAEGGGAIEFSFAGDTIWGNASTKIYAKNPYV